jgi:hypothetical protein
MLRGKYQIHMKGQRKQAANRGNLLAIKWQKTAIFWLQKI